jgi:hypothetical protein
MHQAHSFRIGALLPKAAQVASQVAIAVIATGIASALFSAREPSAPVRVADGKLTARIENAFTPATTLALYPQELMALSSIERFKAQAFTPSAPETSAKPVAAAPARTRDLANVLPPPRPPQATLVAVAPVPTALAPAPGEPEQHGLKIAGVSVPLPSVDFSRYVPNKDDVLGTFARARSAVDWIAHVSSR